MTDKMDKNKIENFLDELRVLCEEKMLQDEFVRNLAQEMKIALIRWQTALNDCKFLKEKIEEKNHMAIDLEEKLSKAQTLIDNEKETHKILYKQKIKYEEYLNEISKQLGDNLQLSQKLCGKKSGISEGSVPSSLDFTLSEESTDTSTAFTEKVWKKHRPSLDAPAPPKKQNDQIINSNFEHKKPQENLKIIPKIVITEPNSIVEEVDSPKPKRFCRQHEFIHTSILIFSTCKVCKKKITLKKSMIKCKNCTSICHKECQDKLPLPCIPTFEKTRKIDNFKSISDYSPFSGIMVPYLLVQCIEEIEARGLNRVGLYRVSGVGRDIKNLKEKFLKYEKYPNFSEIDTNTICGVVKDFLRSLNEPLITYTLWGSFIEIAGGDRIDEDENVLDEVIMRLPRPNRDTLAFIILHLQKIAAKTECKMSINNLAKIFGPTIIGYSSADLTSESILKETKQFVNVMEHLLCMPAEYWLSLLDGEP